MQETDNRMPKSATPDGEYLLIEAWGHATRGGDIWKLRLDGARRGVMWVARDGWHVVELEVEAGPTALRLTSVEKLSRAAWRRSQLTM